MPDARQILDHLAAASRDSRGLALAWHFLIASALAAWAAGWRPAPSHVGRALSIPLFSASAVAWKFGNPFNGAILLAVALALAASRRPAPQERAAPSGPWGRIVGGGLAGFAWAYPHFFEEPRLLDYLLYSPMGVIPCPTLALVLGFLLLAGGSVQGGRMSIAAAAGAFYGLFGWLVLGVTLDVVLAASSAALLAPSLRRYFRGATRSSSALKTSSSKDADRQATPPSASIT